MGNKFACKLVAMLLLIAAMVTALPLTVLAEMTGGSVEQEVYVKSIKVAQAETAADAKSFLEEDGYTFLEGNLNEGTGEDGIWMGIQTTTDPEEAIYDIKLMNMKGGFSLTSVKEALASNETAIAEMVDDLSYLVEEFIDAYDEGSAPAKKAYMALNFFSMVDGKTSISEEEGLGYYIVSGGITHSMLFDILMFCDPDVVDTIIKLLTMGIQLRNGNWMQELSDEGPYSDDVSYGEDEDELNRRAEQLLSVLQLYSQAYNAMYDSGLIPDSLDENFEPVYEDGRKGNLDAEDETVKKLDENRYKFYKVVFDELDKYPYGTNGDTLRDFFRSLEDVGSATELYPLVSVLSDGEFSALSYGCFLELATGVNATVEDFDGYDALYNELTAEVSSVYLFTGVDKALLNDDSIIGFTEEANRNMASTGELEFYDKRTTSERVWDAGILGIKCIGASALIIMGVPKLTMGVVSLAGLASATVGASIKTGILAGVMKVCAAISGMYALIITVIVIAVVWIVTLIVTAIIEEIEGNINWKDNPIPEYMYDVKEVTLSQSSDDGISTEYLKRTVYSFYEVVKDTDDRAADLNARSGDATQWIAMYVSRDKQGMEAKPIKAKDIKVRTGSGETPDGYVPLSRFGEVVAYDLNQWDGDDDVNGIYVFYKQDKTVAVSSGKKYYVSQVYLQMGESDAHCINQLEAAGYTPLNVNLSPDLVEVNFGKDKPIYTYLGYKVSTSKADAIRDIRIVYGASRGNINYGGTTYAECGSNGSVTLYATKYETAGTPILAGSLLCVNDRDDAPKGYEPVCLMAGGPAVSFNSSVYGVDLWDTEYFIYFLPETSFTDGILYLGGVTYFYMDSEWLKKPVWDDDEGMILAYLKEKTGKDYKDEDEEVIMNDYAFLRSGYQTSTVGGDKKYSENIFYYQTYNPYRAIYKVRGTVMEESYDAVSFEGVGYTKWNVLHYTATPQTGTYNSEYHYRLNYNGYGMPALDLKGKLLVAGNFVSGNTHVDGANEMKEAQPIKLSDFVAIGKNDDASGVTGKDSPYVCVTDIYSNATEEVKIYYDSGSRKNEFRFFVVEDVEKRPYVSGVTAIDELTLYRGYGGADAGISRSDITNDMLLAQLANQGATNFNSHRVSLRQLDFWAFGGSISSYDELNAIKFGYRRTAEAKNALRDMFIYFNGFNTDEPPREIYKGEVKYTVLCEIPYNLTGYESAPKIGIYLYGTTDSRAGNRIIDFEVSATPFMEGYETLRTYNGRTMVSEIKEYMSYHWFNHPMKWAGEMFEALQDFFDEGGYTETEQNEYYYLHIKRENEDRREQKPYIESLMLAYSIFNAEQAIERLCEWGADGYVAIDLNQGAGGDWVYLGYIRTADPDQAIREIRTYHTESGGYPGSTLTDGNGSVFNVVGPMDLNGNAGGDYIYLYTSKTATEKPPITDLGAVYSLGTSGRYQTWYDGTEAVTVTYCVQKWESHTYSDLNEDAGGKTIYLNYTTVDTDYVGSGTVERDLGEDLLQSRDPYEDVEPNGKYIGGLYIMDKETVMNELIAAGELPDGSICDCITDQQVYDRLQEMGATTVIKTPMTVTGNEYFSSNTNQVFIGYSRTNKSNKAIKNIAFKVEILSTSEPKERIEIGGKAYKLVAEAASEVESLPTAINILGVHGYHDKLLPRMYLYYSTAGSGDPIYDFSIDGDPLKNGWVTVRSAGGVDPFEEIATKAYEQYELAAKDDGDSYDSELVYSDPLYAWMEDVYELFTPSKSNIKPFFLHVKKYTEPTIEEIKPYIGEIFIAEGANMHEALSKLIKYEPDGYVDCDLNRDAGGRKVYVAYKRVAKAKDAIRDLAIYQGSDPEYVRRININGSSIKYTLVGDVDLNSKAGGKYLYLYYADSNKTGNPIKNITVTEKIDNYLKCGVERATVKRADGNAFTSEYIDLNKRAGGDYLYMIMHRESAEGHRKSELLKVIEVEPTCGEEGSVTNVYQCLDCKSSLSEVTVVPATGKHFDEDGDWDHDCDECYKSGLSPHVAGEPVIEDLVEATEDEDGYYLLVYYCAECEEWLSESEGIIPAGTEFDEERMIASLLGNGSPIAIYFLCGVAILAAIFVFFMKKKSY